ncbi:MAG: DUF5916 domain-containing protein [Bacteroidota bacterium]
MKKLYLLTTIILIFHFLESSAQETDSVVTKTYSTTYLNQGSQIKIDGIIDDPGWDLVDWSGGYVEQEPDPNTTPSEETKMKILYDDKNLYVAFRCFDKDPEGIEKRMSRRDGFTGDWVEINIDSYNDLRTAFSFTITAAGVKGDEFVTNNGDDWDSTWDPIWYVKTNTDSEGWTAEIRIPLSQLRFSKDADQTWGIQSTRRYFRNEERSLWQQVPLNAPGWVSEFGKLKGLKNLKPQKQLEIQPYIVAGVETYEAEAGNPFMDGSETTFAGGLDGKIGITNDLTVDFTINPDFGQVEADPSAIALDGFQIFFQERRPFFIENKNIFDYQFSNSQAGNTFGFDNLFYSRRIGRAPQGSSNPTSEEFVDQPDVTTILGAAKFSGKTKDGWSVGVLESTTAQESASLTDHENERKEVVEPLTNYFVGRVQKDFNDRNSFIGGIFTATNRNLTDNLGFLHKSAYTGGLDFTHQWKNRTWYTRGNFVFSQVNGSEEAIEQTQQSIAHLFNRVDANYLDLDTTRTSLMGTGGNVQFGKAAGDWRFEVGTTWRSPELELNDIGFQRQADDIRTYGWVGYRPTKVLKKVRRYGINYSYVTAYDFGGNLNLWRNRVNGWVNFNNNWNTNGGITVVPVNYSNFALRGGPRLRLNRSISYWYNLNSDSRKKLSGGINHSGSRSEDGAQESYNFGGYLAYQPTNALRLSFSPSISINRDQLQYVTNVELSDRTRYINARIKQETFNMSIRIDYIVAPNFSIQYWGQPFISNGTYDQFKYISNSMAENFDDRFTILEGDQLNLIDGEFQVNEGNELTYSFDNPDFSFVQWRSNLVARWEYIPGSELFLVWSQDVSQSGDVTQGLFRNLEDNILNQQPRNIFLIKATYRFRR